MRILTLTLSLFFSCLALLQAQKEHNIWYFGDRNGIDFNNGGPMPLFDSEMQTFEAAATICDAEGNLLFYSNGGGRDPNLPSGVTPGLIFNRDHQIMYDMGFTEGGGYSARQGALIVPKPEAPGQYYLFTMEELEFDQAGDVPSQPQGRGLSYFEIDMSLNAGLGGVTIADERVHVPLYEGLSGTIHANGTNYWIVVADLGYPDNVGSINQFGVLEVTPDGVGDLVWTDVGSFYLLNPQTEISPNGKYMLSTRKLFQFDNATGEITDLNLQFDTDGVPAAYGFSPNSRYVYYVMPNYTDVQLDIYRYDLEAADIIGSKEFIASRPGTFQAGQMQIGPDGNLYFSEFSGSPFMSVINRIRCPNTEEPTFEADLFSFSFTDFALYFSLGNYTDHVFRSEQDFTLNICPADTISICDGSAELSAMVEDGTYLWSTGEITSSITVDQPGTYTLEAENFCGEAFDTVVVITPEAEGIQIDGDSLLCDGASTTLSVVNPDFYESFSWSTGETTEQIEVSEAGTISLSGTDICGNQSETSLEILESTSPVINEILPSGEACTGESVDLIVDFNDVPVTYLWSDASFGESLEVMEDGIYSVEISNVCGSASAEIELTFALCDCSYELPTGFSPNQDGLNDGFGLVVPCELLESWDLSIYNRWGKEVFRSQDPNNLWNGLVDGEPQPEDVYVWYLTYKEADKEAELISGEVVLLR
ncbi:MAG: gliding motility-associated C-terminal domain-containing protein [Bacteroidetes bacterium]|nr:gliding motility-associated C-terminal domain-containing protein [Bacteroidota bacterium]